MQVWKLGWSPQPGGEFGTTLPEIPVDFLHEKDVFREFLYRINTLGTERPHSFRKNRFGTVKTLSESSNPVCMVSGWSSRTQFEETWATLLGVLVTQPITMDQEETQQEVSTQPHFKVHLEQAC